MNNGDCQFMVSRDIKLKCYMLLSNFDKLIVKLNKDRVLKSKKNNLSQLHKDNNLSSRRRFSFGILHLVWGLEKNPFFRVFGLLSPFLSSPCSSKKEERKIRKARFEVFKIIQVRKKS